MFYVALVTDMNSAALSRVQSAYVAPVPAVFFDAGYRASTGGYDTPGPSMVPIYEPEIVAAAQRAVPALDLLTAIDWLGNNQVRVHVAVGNGAPANTAPLTPSILSGVRRVPPLQTIEFSCEAVDTETNMVLYQWDWGDGQSSDWLGPYNSGTTASASHAWSEYGEYEVKVKARDPFGEESAWSASTSVVIACCMDRVGDANGLGTYPDDDVTLGDIMLMVDVSFISNDCNKLACMAEADVNQDGGASPICPDHLSLGDIMLLVDFLFITGPDVAVLKTCL